MEKNNCITILENKLIARLRSEVIIARARLVTGLRLDGETRRTLQETIARNAPVVEAFDVLRAAVAETSPMYRKLADAAKKGGLSPRQFSVATAYIQHRTGPTLDEIASCMSLLIRADALEDARKVYNNLSDELNGLHYHVRMLHDGFNCMAQKFGFSHLGRISYPWSRLALQFQEEHGQMPDAAALEHYASERGHILAHMRAWGDTTAPRAMVVLHDLLPLIPADAHHYARHVETLTAREKALPSGDIGGLCAASLRLGLRESASAEQGGVIGTCAMMQQPYQGYFTRAEWLGTNQRFHRRVREVDLLTGAVTMHKEPGIDAAGVIDYVNAHIGEHQGVEDQHQADANALAYKTVEMVYKHNPAKLAEIFRQEAELVKSRTQQAAHFAQAMDRARARDEAEGKNAITPKPGYFADSWRARLSRPQTGTGTPASSPSLSAIPSVA